jgi:nitronate monooxygenase
MTDTTYANDELARLLDLLLEAERAGAKVLNEFMADYPSGSEAWQILRKVQRDEAENCALLMRLARGIGHEPSRATGDFVAKALAVDGNAERLDFLNRGQAWVARKIREALPRIPDGELKSRLIAMQDSHMINIAACEALVLSMRKSS